jgi:serine/threonine protein kinase
MSHLTYTGICSQTLEHPNIVQIIGVIQEPEITLVMEFVQHGSLQSYLKIHQETLSQAQLLKFALDVAKVCVELWINVKTSLYDIPHFRVWLTWAVKILCTEIWQLEIFSLPATIMSKFLILAWLKFLKRIITTF